MRKTIYSGITIISLLLLLEACVTPSPYQIYSYDMMMGKDLLKGKQYADAKRYFQDASTYYKDAVTLTYLAAAEYKTDTIENALMYIQEAEKAAIDEMFYLRTLGYKALIFMKIDKEKGIAAPRDYVNYYQHQYPLISIKDVREMLQSGQIDHKKLEEQIDEQVSTYEQEIDQFLKDGTGFYDRHGSRPVH
jgi:tetratricopeptide (TPR) repeat protein